MIRDFLFGFIKGISAGFNACPNAHQRNSNPLITKPRRNFNEFLKNPVEDFYHCVATGLQEIFEHFEADDFFLAGGGFNGYVNGEAEYDGKEKMGRIFDFRGIVVGKNMLKKSRNWLFFIIRLVIIEIKKIIKYVFTREGLLFKQRHKEVMGPSFKPSVVSIWQVE